MKANFFPHIDKTRVIFHSQAEKKFYDACFNSLGKDWDVYYSVTLSGSDKESGLQENELDFLLYHPKFGIIAIEVKGGRIQYDSDKQQFVSIDRYGRKHFIKNPFQQARVWKSRFVKEIKNIGFDAPVTHLVSFPDITTSDFPRIAQVDPILILDQRHLENIEAHLKHVVHHIHPEKYMNFPDIRQNLSSFIKGSNYSSKIFLKDYIHTHESRLVDFETIHETFVQPIANTRHLAIEGEAGTGKTMLAKALSEHFLANNLKVLFLSSNEILNKLLAKELGENCTLDTYEGLGQKYGFDLLNKPQAFTGADADWVQFEAPEKLRIAIESSMTRYDVIICDESQDVQPFWWDAIKALMLPSDNSRLYIFFDRNQGIFGSGGQDKSFVPEDILPVPGPYFPLVNNYRTTREIADFARQFRMGKTALDSHCTRLGYLPKLITYKNAEDAQKKLADLCEELVIEEGIKTKDLCLLSARKLDANESVVREFKQSNKGFQFVDIKKQPDQLSQKQIPAATIQSFKGLETDIGIICNISEYNMSLDHPIMASLLYVACTRAKHMLYIFVKEDDEKLKKLEEALNKILYNGSLIVDQFQNNQEIIGTVEFYDSKRFGIIKFNASHNNKNKAIFFPQDLDETWLSQIVLGQQIAFIPKIVGETLVADKMALVADQNDSSSSVEAS